jgi:hypothetical protein
MWDVMESYALDCAVELRLGLDSPDPKERLTSARELLSAYVRLPPRPSGLDSPDPNETDEQRGQRLRTLFRHAPPVLRKALLEWKQEEEQGARN